MMSCTQCGSAKRLCPSSKDSCRKMLEKDLVVSRTTAARKQSNTILSSETSSGGTWRRGGSNPPSNQKLKAKKEATNFDTEFTKEDPVLTPINQDIVRTINQEEFAGFSFDNTGFGKLLTNYTQTAKKN